MKLKYLYPPLNRQHLTIHSLLLLLIWCGKWKSDIMCSHWVKWQEWHRKCSTNYFQCRCFHLIHATLLLHTQLNFIEGLTVPRATLIEELNCRTHSSASVFLTYPWWTQEHVCQVWGVEGWCDTFIQAIDQCVSISCKGASDYRNQFAKSRKRSPSMAKMSYQEKLV